MLAKYIRDAAGAARYAARIRPPGPPPSDPAALAALLALMRNPFDLRLVQRRTAGHPMADVYDAYRRLAGGDLDAVAQILAGLEAGGGASSMLQNRAQQVREDLPRLMRVRRQTPHLLGQAYSLDPQDEMVAALNDEVRKNPYLELGHTIPRDIRRFATRGHQKALEPFVGPATQGDLRGLLAIHQFLWDAVEKQPKTYDETYYEKVGEGARMGITAHDRMRQDLLKGLLSLHQEQDYRPNESIPEDYYAL